MGESEFEAVDRFLADLRRWKSERDVETAITARSRERHLRRLAEQEARFVGVLVDLAEQRIVVAVTLTNGRRFRGIVAAVAPEFVVIRDGEGDAFLRRSAIAQLRTSPETPRLAASGNRSAPLELGFVSVLDRLSDTQPRVAIGTVGTSNGQTGTLLAIGEDVLSLAPDGEELGTAYFPLDAVLDLTLLEHRS